MKLENCFGKRKANSLSLPLFLSFGLLAHLSLAGPLAHLPFLPLLPFLFLGQPNSGEQPPTPHPRRVVGAPSPHPGLYKRSRAHHRSPCCLPRSTLAFARARGSRNRSIVVRRPPFVSASDFHRGEFRRALLSLPDLFPWQMVASMAIFECAGELSPPAMATTASAVSSSRVLGLGVIAFTSSLSLSLSLGALGSSNCGPKALFPAH